MNLIKVLGSLFLLAALTFVPSAFAGGQLVDLNADSYGATNSDGTYGRIMRFVWRGAPCEGTEVTFKFVDPKDGDYVMTTSGNATFVFTKDRQPYYKNGEQVCGTNAKMGSKVLGERNVTVMVKSGSSVWADSPVIKVDFDGQYHAGNSTNGYNYMSSQDDPYYALIQSQQTSNPTPPSATINAWLLKQELSGGNSRKVTIKWSAFDGYSGTFKVYAKSTSNKNNWEESFDGSKGPSADITLKADQDYHLKINGCMDKWGTCVDSNVLTLPKLQRNEGGTIVVPSPSTIITTPAPTNSNVEDLNKKVENLQTQLDQSKKTQSVLEQRINDLVNFIKKLFPFFK